MMSEETSAGIFVYCVYDNEILILLGKEQKTKYTLFSDFGGYKNKNETSQQTAIREFEEETMNILINSDHLKKIINKLPYFFNKKNKYMNYILKIDYTIDNIITYNKIRNKLNDCLPKSIKYNFGGCFEKTELKWFTQKNILENKHLMRPDFFRSFLYICNNDLLVF
jgi:hypothetical protein